jgi:hypothetical protein
MSLAIRKILPLMLSLVNGWLKHDQLVTDDQVFDGTKQFISSDDSDAGSVWKE